jgi:hypothetical protein
VLACKRHRLERRVAGVHWRDLIEPPDRRTKVLVMGPPTSDETCRRPQRGGWRERGAPRSHAVAVQAGVTTSPQ